MRGVVQLAVLVFAATMGVMAGNRLTSEAMAVLVGVVCGVLAGIPTSVIILMFTRRLTEAQMRKGQPDGPIAYPPVVVIQPERSSIPAGNADGQQRLFPLAGEGCAAQRAFTIVGGEDGW